MSPPLPTDVWIDTDPAIGVPGADVDDGLALIQAFHSPELRVRGVSAVFGNAPLTLTYPIGCDVVSRFGPANLAVHAGATCADELGWETDAVRALARALGQAPLVIIALGPVTNVASAVECHPELVDRIESIVMVAARRPGQRFLSSEEQPQPFPDLNFDSDPAAMQILLESGIDLVFAPWEVSSHVWLTEEDLDELERASAAGAYIAGESRPWLSLWQEDLHSPGFNPFDTLAIGWVTHPHLLEHFRCGVWIESGPSDTASPEEQRAGLTKPYLLVDPDRRDGPQARYCHQPAAGFKPLLLERLAGPGG
ncbi:MAG: nucleoside hydrolase [Proteobacteria bacterium]|nr:nucleoside hydrolase [Pseudomonadota bacterium]